MGEQGNLGERGEDGIATGTTQRDLEKGIKTMDKPGNRAPRVVERGTRANVTIVGKFGTNGGNAPSLRRGREKEVGHFRWKIRNMSGLRPKEQLRTSDRSGTSGTCTSRKRPKMTKRQ